MFDLPSLPAMDSTNARATSGSLSAARTTQKGTGAGGGATNMRDLLRHEGQEVSDRPVLDTPHWKLPKRVRGETYELMKQKEGLRNGFQGLLQGTLRDEFVASSSGGNPDVDVRRALKNVGDRSRKHFEERPSDERPWKPGFKITVPEILPARPRGKRPVPFDTMVGNDHTNATLQSQHMPSTSSAGAVENFDERSAFSNKPGGYRQRVPHEELGDLPRGRKHARPMNQIGNNINGTRLYGGPQGAVAQEQQQSENNTTIAGEATLFKPKKVVVDSATGIPRSWQGPPFFDTAAVEEQQRKDEAERKRHLKEQLASDTLIGGHAARVQRVKPNIITGPNMGGAGGGASPSIDKLGFTGGSKVLAPSTGGGGTASGRRGDVTGLVMGVGSSSSLQHGGMRGAPVDVYARKEARMAIAKDISDVKSLPSY